MPFAEGWKTCTLWLILSEPARAGASVLVLQVYWCPGPLWLTGFPQPMVQSGGLVKEGALLDAPSLTPFSTAPLLPHTRLSNLNMWATRLPTKLLPYHSHPHVTGKDHKSAPSLAVDLAGAAPGVSQVSVACRGERVLSPAAESPLLAVSVQHPLPAWPEFSTIKALFKIMHTGTNSPRNYCTSALTKYAGFCTILYNKWGFILHRIAMPTILCWKGVAMSPPVQLEKHSFWLVPALT